MLLATRPPVYFISLDPQYIRPHMGCGEKSAGRSLCPVSNTGGPNHPCRTIRGQSYGGVDFMSDLVRHPLGGGCSRSASLPIVGLPLNSELGYPKWCLLIGKAGALIMVAPYDADRPRRETESFSALDGQVTTEAILVYQS